MANNKDLKKVARGGTIYLLGRIGGTFLQFAVIIIVIRLIEKSEYGFISLAWLFIQIAATIGLFGLGNGLPRFLNKYNTKKDKKLVGRFAGSVLCLTSCLSLLITIFLFWSAPFIANLLAEPDMEEVLKISSLALPAMVLMHTFTAIFRGTQEVFPKVIFEDFIFYLTRILLLLGILVFYLGFQEIVWAYVLSVYITTSLYIIYAIRKWMGVLSLEVNSTATKEIAFFSMPLLGASIMGSIAEWAGPLSLGYLSSSEAVATFNAPMRLAKVIIIPLTAMAFLYMPLATKLFEQKNMDSLKDLYANITKWSFLITMPFIVYCIMDAEFLVTILFGKEYIDSANILRILVIGFSVHTLFGPNGITLIAIGYSRPIFYGQVIVALLSLSLCWFLVPNYAAFGAALAVSTARVFSNFYIAIFLYNRTKLHPFFGHYIKPIFFISAIGSMSFFLLPITHTSNELIHLFYFLLLVLLALAAPFLTQSVTLEDFELLQSIEKRIRKDNRVTSWLKLRLKTLKK
jgi:O-antigen/teichoic acid export membrane protein